MTPAEEFYRDLVISMASIVGVMCVALLVWNLLGFGVLSAMYARWQRNHGDETGSTPLAGWLIPLGLFVVVAYCWPVVGR